MKPTLRVALSNDDGQHSPFIDPLASTLNKQSWVNSVLPVVPSVEQSWVADAITRFRNLRAEKHDFDGVAGFLVDGSPADCASLAINNLHQGIRPDLLISGINMGTNAGLAFFLCSGTVGAVTQAFLNGVPGVALSSLLPQQIYKLWTAHDHAAVAHFKADFTRLVQVCVNVVRVLVQTKAWDSADYYTVNVPWEAELTSKLTLTSLTKASFKPLFEQLSELEFKHKFGGFTERQANTAILPPDFERLDRGEISVTPISYQLEPKLSPQLIDKIQGTPLS